MATLAMEAIGYIKKCLYLCCILHLRDGIFCSLIFVQCFEHPPSIVCYCWGNANVTWLHVSHDGYRLCGSLFCVVY